MSEFNSLQIKSIKKETEKSVSIVFNIPEILESKYKFKAGQYITLKADVKGKQVVRSYSICSAPSSSELKIGVKAIPNGLFSNYALNDLNEGVYNKFGNIFNLEKAFETGEVVNPYVKINRYQAITRLKKAKTSLELEMINQEEFDSLNELLIPIIK